MSDTPTPRTDAQPWINRYPEYHEGAIRWISSEFARQLERELAGALSDLDFRRGLYKLQSERLERTERELAETISVRDSLSNAADKLEKDKEYNARLCDTLREELATERALADRLAGELRWRVEAGGYGAEQGKQALAAWKEARRGTD